MNPDAQERHAVKVARIVAQLRAHTNGKPLSLRKKAVSHQVPKPGDLRHRDDKIDISDLTEILEIDPVRRVCVAESGVTFVDLVAATLAHGLVPIVVPELKTITIGGAVAGCSIESMSFVRGGFHDTCRAYEVITAKGDVLHCTPENEHALVFQMVHGAFGTLGILSKLTFELVPAKKYVHLRYERYTTLADYQAAIADHAERRDVDFMDGIIHSPQLYVLAAGRFVDRAPYTNRYDWVKVYYTSTARRFEDYLETPHYFFRYDRGVTNVRPKSFVGRLLFGKLLASSEWLRIAEKVHFLLPREKPTVTLDVFVPFSKVPEFLAWYERELDFYPLWCVPYRRVHDYEWLTDGYWKALGDEMFLDLAIYGMKQRGPRNAHRMMEEKLRELGGIKTLISHNYYPEEEFWQIFNKPNYDAVKQLVDPDNAFRDLYTKTCKAAMGKV
ncbi:MAG: FAD-binding oxidoreductase [Deltaproteobacteria bacterium]|nr:FAD-binding oxidoreductase [Deltaproteobacteria bacterium]MCW5801021.1 FAD-binding oxidoreductase [Deltaproteobacteria bacterium]